MTITAVGKIHIADQLSDRTDQIIANVAIGTGSPTATELGVELDRKGILISHVDNVVTYAGHWDVDDQIEGTITEAGLFVNPNVGSTMVFSGTCSQVKGINDPLDVTWTFTLP